MLNSLTSESNNKKVTDWISTRISLEKVKLFGLVFSPIKFDLGKYRRILKISNCFLVQKSSCSLPSNFFKNFLHSLRINKWSHNHRNESTRKHFMLRTVKLTRNTIKSNFICNGRGIAFDTACSRNFGNEFARNIIIFGVDNSSSSHTDISKNNFWVLGEGPFYQWYL